MALAACGAASGDHVPPLAALPLIPGVTVTLDAQVCDPGANVFCVRELVVRGDVYHTSDAMLAGERRLLHAGGWKRMNAQVGTQYGADSPGDKLRVVYATAWADLTAADYGWIRREHAVTLALSRAVLTHTPTLSMMLEYGAGSS